MTNTNYDFGYIERALRTRWSGLDPMVDAEALARSTVPDAGPPTLPDMISSTGRTPTPPPVQNFPGTSAHVLEVARATGAPAGDQTVCTHCGGRRIREGEADHMCLGFIFDWIEALDGEYRKHTFNEIVAVMIDLKV